jgi:hypothetical protein
MSPDKLEQFIRDNREQFDDLEPDPTLWNKIRTRKSPVIRINWKGAAWKAAAVVVIFIASYWFHDYMASRKMHMQQESASTQPENSNPLLQELVEAEAFYTSQINFKRDELRRLTQNSPQIGKEVDLELVELDKIYKELKADLKDNTDNEEVIEAMIQNYRLKLEILEEILYQVKKSHQSQNEQEDEKQKVQI